MIVSLVLNRIGDYQKRLVRITENKGEKFLILQPEKVAMTRGEVRIATITSRN